MKKLNFNEFKKKSEVIVSKELMININGGNADESTDNSTEGVKPLGKFGQGTKVNP